MRLARLATISLLVNVAACGSDPPPAQPPPQLPPPSAPAPTAPQPVATGDAVLEGDRIRIAKQIFYDTDKDEIRPESYPVLAAVAQVVATHPEITMLIVEGHTDNQGSFDHNRQLSEKRSSAVVRYLSQIGVKVPMQAPGYGATSQLCLSPDETCRQTNRRVEFKVKRSDMPAK